MEVDKTAGTHVYVAVSQWMAGLLANQFRCFRCADSLVTNGNSESLKYPRSILHREYMQHDITNRRARDARNDEDARWFSVACGVSGMPRLNVDITSIRREEGARGTCCIVLLVTRILNQPV